MRYHLGQAVKVKETHRNEFGVIRKGQWVTILEAANMNCYTIKARSSGLVIFGAILN